MKNEIDALCIQQLKKGSQKSFNQIYDAYATRLYGYCYQYTKSKEETEELIHDLFVQLWQKRELIRDDLPIISLLYHILRNTLINRFRSQVNSPVYEMFTDYANHLHYSTNDASKKIEYDDFYNQLNQFIQGLSPAQQKISRLKIFDAMSIDQIAEELNISKQTVKNQLTIALKYLRNRISLSDLILLAFIFL